MKKNEIVIVNIIGMHRGAEYFSEPMQFLPERFAPDAEKGMPKYAYLPFGGGSRVCIGNHFALMEGQIALAHLAQHLRFDLLPGSTEIEPEPLITLRPKGGVQVRVSRRERRSALARDAAAPGFAPASPPASP